MFLEKIYRQNYNSVRLLAKRMIGDDEASKDIAQDVFIRLHNALGSGQKILNVPAWLGRVTYNCSINHIRDSGKTLNSNNINFESAERNAEVIIIENEEADAIRKAVRKLKKREQVLIRLWCAGMNYRQMSDIMGMKYSTVGSTLARTLKKLGKIYHEKEGKMRK